MWGQNWGTMIWGASATNAPALSFWGTLLLGAMLGVVGFRLLQTKGPRTAGFAVLALALLAPVVARAALPFMFSNGTVADATQVNANFAKVDNTYTVESFENLITGETVTLTAMCNSGDVVIGGFTRAQGVTNLTGDQRFAAIAPIGPAPAAQGWTATATGATMAPDFLDVFAECIRN